MDSVSAPGSALLAHLGNGAVMQMLFVILTLFPGHLLAHRIRVGMFIRVRGDLGQIGLMATALPRVLTGPGHEFRIGMRIAGGGGVRRCLRVGGAHGCMNQGLFPDWTVLLV